MIVCTRMAWICMPIARGIGDWKGQSARLVRRPRFEEDLVVFVPLVSWCYSNTNSASEHKFNKEIDGPLSPAAAAAACAKRGR